MLLLPTLSITMPYGNFIRFDGDHTVAVKIFARRRGEIRRPNIFLPVLQPSSNRHKSHGQPTAIGFEESHPELRMASKHAAGTETSQGQHLFHRLGVDASGA